MRWLLALAVSAVALLGCAAEQDGDPEPVDRAVDAGDAAEASPAPTPTSAPTPTPAPTDSLEGSVVALDPGHNGGNADHPDEIARPVDAGGFEKPCNTVGTQTADGYTEAQFALDLAAAVRDRLEDDGAEVHLTRETNDGVGPCIDERGQFAGEVSADLLVSLHADGGPETEGGFHVIAPDLVPGHTDDITEPSAELAQALRDALVGVGRSPAGYVSEDGIHVRDDIGTLNRADVPAVMVETGNMRYPPEADYLHSADGRAELADAVHHGIRSYVETAGRPQP